LNAGFHTSNLFSLSMLSSLPEIRWHRPIRMPYVKYEGKSTVGNTRWPGICIKRALPRNFPYLRYKVFASMDASSASH
jgi:hypothetical protein